MMILAGLRKMRGEVARETKKMPGKAAGRVEGQMEILLGQIEKRFGLVSPAVRKRLAGLKPDQLRQAGLRLLDARRMEDLFGR